MKYQLNINYLLFPTTDSLTEIEKGLLEKALSACGDAYAPYSKFKVGASVLLGNGQVIIGSNQENIAYPSRLCAERVALFHCGSNYPNETVEVLCIVAKGDLLPVDRLLSPCGGCRLGLEQYRYSFRISFQKPYRSCFIGRIQCRRHYFDRP